MGIDIINVARPNFSTTHGGLHAAVSAITVLGGVSSTGHGWLGALLAQPAAWTMPTAFLVAAAW